jgi:hypothetical protein
MSYTSEDVSDVSSFTDTDETSDEDLERLADISLRIHIHNPSTEFIREYNVLSTLKQEVEELLQKRLKHMDARNEYVARSREAQNDMLFRNTHFVDFTRTSGFHMSNILMSSLVDEIKVPHIQYSLFTTAFDSSIIDIRFDYERLIMKSILELWIQKSQIIHTDSSHKLIRTGFLVSFRGFFDTNADEVIGHEIFVVVDKIQEAKYKMYIFDNIPTKDYEREPHLPDLHDFITEIVYEFITNQKRVDMTSQPVILDNAFPMGETMGLIERDGVVVVSGVNYTCRTVARRMALYASFVKKIHNTTTFNEYKNKFWFHQNFVGYSIHIYRMFKWILENEKIWPRVSEHEGLGKRKSTQMPNYAWPLILPAKPFCLHEYLNLSSISQELIVQLHKDNSYIQIMEPMPDPRRSKSTKYYFSSTGDAFQVDYAPTCTVSSHFHIYQ